MLVEVKKTIITCILYSSQVLSTIYTLPNKDNEYGLSKSIVYFHILLTEMCNTWNRQLLWMKCVIVGSDQLFLTCIYINLKFLLNWLASSLQLLMEIPRWLYSTMMGTPNRKRDTLRGYHSLVY